MAAISTKQKDVREWIESVIHSCTTIEQCEGARNLIDNFQKKGVNPDENRFQFTLGILNLKTILGRKIIQIKKDGKEVNN